MEERVFNIFMYFDEGVAIEYGVRHHRISGTDAEKLTYLQSSIAEDHAVARRFKLSRSFTISEWGAASRYGQIQIYFEKAYLVFNAKRDPISCVTPIVNGVPMVDRTTGFEPFRGGTVSEISGRGSVPDYLEHYFNGNEFRFAALIHDDYFKAIKILFHANLHVSCAKLLMSCIDTLAFVEFGDTRQNFIKWLDAYADLSRCGITSDELWEFRNSIVHMTNLASRQVLQNRVSAITPYVGGPDIMPSMEGVPKPFNLLVLVNVVNSAISKWAASYSDPDKFIKFIERYDTTISDSRIAIFEYPNGDAQTKTESGCSN